MPPALPYCGTSGIIPPAGRFALRVTEVFMNRRNFLRNTGIVGAGLLGAGNSAAGLLRAGTVTHSIQISLWRKNCGFYCAPAAVLV